jgi:hypothetical protein
MFGYLRLEATRLVRDVKFAAISLAGPLLMFVALSGGVKGPSRTATLAYLTVAMAALGAIGAVLNNGSTGLAEDKGLGWLRQLRLTPLRSRQVVAARGLGEPVSQQPHWQQVTGQWTPVGRLVQVALGTPTGGTPDLKAVAVLAGERRFAALRDDVLSYRTPALPGQTPVTGPAVLTLALTSSASHAHLEVAILATGPGALILLGEAVVHASGLHRRVTRAVQVTVGVQPAIVPAGRGPCSLPGVRGRPGPRSGGDVGIGQVQVVHRPGVGQLVFQRSVIALEHRDEQGEGQERVGAKLEQPHVIVAS